LIEQRYYKTCPEIINEYRFEILAFKQTESGNEEPEIPPDYCTNSRNINNFNTLFLYPWLEVIPAYVSDIKIVLQIFAILKEIDMITELALVYKK
jgi:hypothetical protein